MRYNDCTIKIEGALKSMKMNLKNLIVPPPPPIYSSNWKQSENVPSSVFRCLWLARDDMKFDGFGPYENFRSRYSRCSSIDDDRDYSLDCGINWSAES